MIPPPPMLISETIGRYKGMITPKEDSAEEPEAEHEAPPRHGREPLPPMFGEDHEQPEDVTAPDEKAETSGRLGVFSPSSILRRFRKRDEDEASPDPKHDLDQDGNQ
jgi:hypothetical protein